MDEAYNILNPTMVAQFAQRLGIDLSSDQTAKIIAKASANLEQPEETTQVSATTTNSSSSSHGSTKAVRRSASADSERPDEV